MTGIHKRLFEPIERLRGRPDFRRNPVRALGRRFLWRARWAYRIEPWCIPAARGGMLLVPKSGPGALLYYLGSSEPETAQFLVEFLRPGMVFWDVGAHIGEFSLLASQRVGASGRVDAFEPHPQLGDLIRGTIDANGLTNVEVHPYAVTDRSGTAEFFLDREPSVSHLLPSAGESKAASSVTVSTLLLDDFSRARSYTADLIKVDVEGAENLVLRGAQSLLQLPPEHAPVWITEFAPDNCTRYHYHPHQLLDEFSRHGYRNFSLTPSGLISLQPGEPPARDCLNFVSTKNEIRTSSHIASGDT